MTPDQAPPLADRVVLRTGDLAELNAHLARALPPRRVSGSRLAARVHAVPMPAVTPMYVAYGGKVTETVPATGPYVVVHVPVAGQIAVAGSRPDFVATPRYAAVTPAAGPLTLRWNRASAAMLFRLDRKALEAELVDLIDAPVEAPLRFQVRMDLDAPAAASWLRTALFLAAEVGGRGSLLENPLLAADLERILLRGLLLCQPHSYSTLLAAGGTDAELPAYVAAAVALLEAAPARRVGTEALARQVNVSPRLLQAGFRAHLGLSPTQYLRQLRLRHVHEDLAGSDPARRPMVAEVAYRWGFTHLGRFAQDYRARYGESPSQTLHRR
ncbi:MAG TPA: AraC family transcriptional regulator [Mycobacteriales bacterium]|nr:AraC family transcriptional regulator [Mycobacteriales bacterium]